MVYVSIEDAKSGIRKYSAQIIRPVEFNYIYIYRSLVIRSVPKKRVPK